MSENNHTPEQDWKGMSGAVAWQIIERHADNWTDIGNMMEQWLAANSFKQQRDDLLAALEQISESTRTLGSARIIAREAIASLK